MQPPDCGLVCRLEAAEEVGAAGGASPESPLERGIIAGPEQLQDSDGERDAGLEQAPTIYRDIWSLRASLELHAAASSDHSSSGNDRDSVRSGDSSGSGSGGAAPVFPPPSPPPTPMPRPADGETGGPRKLLQMDSGYASIEGRGVGDDGPPSAPEKRSSFTSAGREATVGCSFESPAQRHPSVPAARVPGLAALRAATTASMRRQTRCSTSFYATTRTSTTPCLPQHAIGRARTRTLMHASSGSSGAGSTATLEHALRPPPHPRPNLVPPAPRAHPCAAETVSTARPTAEQVMTRPRPPSPSSRRSPVVDARGPACALGPRVRCWTSWRPASTTGSSHRGWPSRSPWPLRWPRPRPRPLTTARSKPAPRAHLVSLFGTGGAPVPNIPGVRRPGAPALGPRAWSTSAVPQAPQRAHAQSPPGTW